MGPGQALLRKWDERVARLHPRMEITSEGLMLGAGTILAKMIENRRGTPTFAFDDEPRAMALLSTAYERPVDPFVLKKMQRACELWNEGEKALAHIHLSYAKLPQCDEERALRLFVADELLEAVTPAALMKAQGFETALLKFDPDQPRIPSGNGQESGRWTSDGTEASASVTSVSYRTRGRLKTLSAFLEWLRTRLKGSNHESPQEKTPPVHEEKKPASKPPEAEQLLNVDANKLHHIFDNPDHPFGNFVSRYGSQEAAFRAIEDTARAAVKEQRIEGQFRITVEVGGRRLIVKGNVMEDGTLKIGTAYPWKN